MSALLGTAQEEGQALVNGVGSGKGNGRESSVGGDDECGQVSQTDFPTDAGQEEELEQGPGLLLQLLLFIAEPASGDRSSSAAKMLMERANMISDISRTGTYRKAIMGNAAVAFQDKLVLDVGAGETVVDTRDQADKQARASCRSCPSRLERGTSLRSRPRLWRTRS